MSREKIEYTVARNIIADGRIWNLGTYPNGAVTDCSALDRVIAYEKHNRIVPPSVIRRVIGDMTDLEPSKPVIKQEELNAIPVITAKEDLVLEFGSDFNYSMLNIKATDREEDDLTKKVVKDGNVNTSVEGKHEIRLSVEDKQGAIGRKTVYVTVNPQVVEPEPEPPTVGGEEVANYDNELATDSEFLSVNEFDELTAKAQVKELDRLIDLSNKGSLSDEKYYELLNEYLMVASAKSVINKLNEEIAQFE